MEGIIEELQDLKRLKWSRKKTGLGPVGNHLVSCEVIDDIFFYYKLSDYDPQSGIVGHECINEIVSGRIMDLMEIKHTKYTLVHAEVRVDGHVFQTWLCRWEIIRDPYASRITMEEYCLAYKSEEEPVMLFCLKKGWCRFLSEMLLVDYIILNRHRAGENIEVYRDRFSKRARLAPLFDQGDSLVCHIHSADELEGYDVLEDVPVISFVGGQSTRDNLKLIPCSERKRLTLPEDIDRDELFKGLNGILDERYFDLIWEMIVSRIESARMILKR